MSLGLLERHRLPEIMDQPSLEPGRHLQALSGLARINLISDCTRILGKPLFALARKTPERNLRVLDVATGSGDMPVRLWRRAQREGIRLAIDGCDISPTALAAARERANQAGAAMQFIRLDVLRDPLPTGYDAVVCSTFLHHLSEEDAVRLLARMARAAERAIFVNDLARSRMGLFLAHTVCRLLTLSDVVHTDGPRSVVAAFTPAEALALAERAGLAGATVERHWPCRYLLSWTRSEGNP